MIQSKLRESEADMKRAAFFNLFFIAMLLLLPACVRRNRAISTTSEMTIQSGGLERTYLLHVPPDYDGSRSWPLVFVFHGGFGNGEKMETVTGFSQLADEAGFIVVYPNAHLDHWNDGRSTDPKYTDTDDVGFVSDLIDALSQTYSIDSRRIYAAGVSNGGIFSYRLACELSDRLAAIGPVAGSLAENLVATCDPAQAISIIHIHGLADQLVRFGGGEVPGPYGGIIHPVLETLALWVGWNDCPGAPQTSSLPDVDPDDGTTVQVSTYAVCRDNTSISLYLIEGGGHTWPGAGEVDTSDASGNTSRDFSATQVIWEFFEQHPKP
jgi:polyhydroxybutyrate depolymerase